MKYAGWARASLYGLAIVLCQPLLGCSDAVPEKSGGAQAGAKAEAGISADAPLIISFGDSLYAGYQLGPKEGLAPVLQAALNDAGIAARVQNAGVSGDTTAAGLQRLGFVLDNAPKKPDLFLVGLGGNDMLRGIGPEQTRQNLTAILDELAKRDIAVVLTGMKVSPNMGKAYAAEFEAIFPALAKRDGVALYPFILDGVITDPQLMLDDQLHPNAKGVAKMVEALVPVVAKALPPQTAP
jgi:acyl-CoA thioesterase-1